MLTMQNTRMHGTFKLEYNHVLYSDVRYIKNNRKFRLSTNASLLVNCNTSLINTVLAIFIEYLLGIIDLKSVSPFLVSFPDVHPL